MKTNKKGRPEGCICEQFAYLPHSDVYLSSSDITKLDAICLKYGYVLCHLEGV